MDGTPPTLFVSSINAGSKRRHFPLLIAGCHVGFDGSHPQSIEVLLLDVGGVLIPPVDASHVAQVERELHLEPGGLGPLLFDNQAWYDVSSGVIDEQEYWLVLGHQIGVADTVLKRTAMPVFAPQRVDPSVVELVEASRSGTRAAVLSNATLALEERLRALNVRHLFEPIINSARVGLRKPDPMLFRYALDLLGVPAEKIVFVDDKARNTEAAAILGFHTVLFRSPDDLRSALIHHNVLSS